MQRTYFFKIKFEHHRYFHGVKFDKFRWNSQKYSSQHAALMSYKCHGDLCHCYKTIRGNVSVIVYAYRQVCACKSNGRFFRHKNQLDALIQSAFILVGL